jgi:hypothetical protein
MKEKTNRSSPLQNQGKQQLNPFVQILAEQVKGIEKKGNTSMTSLGSGVRYILEFTEIKNKFIDNDVKIQPITQKSLIFQRIKIYAILHILYFIDFC